MIQMLRLNNSQNGVDGVSVRCKKLDITNAHLSTDSERTQDGMLHRNVVATKTYVDFTVRPIYNDEMKPILDILNQHDFWAHFFDPNVGSIVHLHMYCGDRKVTVLKYESINKVLYGECTFNIIEI